MKRLCLLLLATLLCSCGTSLTTSSPAQSHAAAKAYREKDGSVHVVGDWDYVAISTTSEPPTAAVGGFKADLESGKTTYAHYVYDMNYKPRAGAFSFDPADVAGNLKVMPHTRAQLDQAAQGSGLTISLPKYRTKQVFSAAYLRGFLQKVDETVRNPAASTPVPGPWYEYH